MGRFRMVFGLGIWVLLIVLFSIGLRQWNSNERENISSDLAGYLIPPRKLVEVNFESEQTVRYGDPVFWDNGERMIRIGEIARVESRDSTEMQQIECKTAYVQFYARAPHLNANDQLVYFSAPREIEWVIRMMFPPERRQRIGELIAEAYKENHEIIVSNFRPIIESALREALPMVEQDLRNALAKREDRFRKIGDRYREDIVKKDLLPLVENEIWPIVQSESEDVVDDIGQKIWKKASLFRFGWRVMYDSTPLPKRDLTKKEFERFVRNDAIPVIQKHMDELIRLQEQIIHEIANNKEVRRVVGQSLMKIADDPEVQQIVAEVLDEVFVNNDNLIAIFESHWKGESARKALAIAGERLEPTVKAIGEELFGNPEIQITPEFSRVLRYKILKKDARWFVLRPAELPSNRGSKVSQLPVVLGEGDTQNPFHVPR